MYGASHWAHSPLQDGTTALLTCLLAIASVVAILAVVIISVYFKKRMEKSIYDEFFTAIKDTDTAANNTNAEKEYEDGQPFKSFPSYNSTDA
ncbi:hypothetical protein NW768_011958 [Fusarium equiseti]|uniref:Uncharacterized protein n=1 Tax=Fusarium equiseti TaxID=61235 RepID=A0ABQ8QW24_FUSEQ|nr:hypothetical protein NW768_011958 [Fusarium equiseti]